MNNKSKVYGYYGGVTKENLYVPPGSPDFVPQPSRTIFTEADRQALNAAVSSVSFYTQNAPNIMLRTSLNAGAAESFTITTSAHPADKIVYNAELDGINLNIMDGGYF